MECEVRGRTEKPVFLHNREIRPEDKEGKDCPLPKRLLIRMFQITLTILILKLISARPSDIRDIATLVWKNSIPEDL